MHYYWHTYGPDQGQIVEVKHAQVAGAPEGEQGRARGLVLTIDHSDRTWTVTRNRKVLSNGARGDIPPTVEEAMKLG